MDITKATTRMNAAMNQLKKTILTQTQSTRAQRAVLSRFPSLIQSEQVETRLTALQGACTIIYYQLENPASSTAVRLAADLITRHAHTIQNEHPKLAERAWAQYALTSAEKFHDTGMAATLHQKIANVQPLLAAKSIEPLQPSAWAQTPNPLRDLKR